MQRRALGFLFLVLTAAFVLIALAAARAEQWLLALPTVVLAAWLATLAAQGLRRR